ncbi:hypothetical protein [Paenibacillus elgii]|uniref:hypothetical protein n=1 Tax=Paenibacillus elgii TaxID=189691 RepID=UPI000248DED5|nr:hypothetical protein [Paenibacillus elgii]
MTAKLCVPLTPDFRLTSDGERNYTVEQRVVVDPTRAPGYKPPENGLAPEPREEWRDTGNYWPLTDRGLIAALKYVAHRTVVAAEITDLAGFIAALSEWSERVAAAVNNDMKTEVSA